MAEFLSEHYGSILWAIGGLYLLQLEIRALFDPRVQTLSEYFWRLIGYTDATRWAWSPVKIIVAVGWIVLTSHLFVGWP